MAQPPAPQEQSGPLIPFSGAAPRLRPNTVYRLVTFLPLHLVQTIFCPRERTSTSNWCLHLSQTYSNVGIVSDSMRRAGPFQPAPPRCAKAPVPRTESHDRPNDLADGSAPGADSAGTGPGAGACGIPGGGRNLRAA